MGARSRAMLGLTPHAGPIWCKTCRKHAGQTLKEPASLEEPAITHDDDTMKRSGSVVVVVAAAWCACALGWPRGATEEMHKKSQEHREMHRKSKGLLGEISTMSIMKVYPKPILREMHDFWCQEREEARVDRVESAVCDHWEDVRGGGFYMGANKSPPVDEVEEMHARGPRPSAARFFARGAPFTPLADAMVRRGGSLEEGREGLRALQGAPRARGAGGALGALNLEVSA